MAKMNSDITIIFTFMSKLGIKNKDSQIGFLKKNLVKIFKINQDLAKKKRWGNNCLKKFCQSKNSQLFQRHTVKYEDFFKNLKQQDRKKYILVIYEPKKINFIGQTHRICQDF